MLRLAYRIVLSVDVADLLEVQRALQGNLLVDAAPKEYHVLGALEPIGQVFAAPAVLGP